jgi:hypothetical protein
MRCVRIPRVVLGLAAALVSSLALAAPVDRVVIVFDAPETGGPAEPQLVFARELAFEARLEALASGEPLLDDRGFIAERHVQSALDRHIATELLAHLPLERDLRVGRDACDDPDAPLDESDLERRTKIARAVVTARARGAEGLRTAAEAEGVGETEVSRLLRREAMAARYLDVMVTPMLAPSDAELRDLQRATPSLRERPFDVVRCDLRRAIVSARLGAALAAFRQSSQARVHVQRAGRT